jgi:acetyl esterase
MTLPIMHPEAQRILDAIAASGEPPLDTLPVAEARRLADARVIRTNFAPDPVGDVWDEVIEGPGGGLRLRLYRPRRDVVLPVLLFFHGGGWTVGNLDTHDPHCRRLALRAECLVVSVEYRLAPEHRFPAAVDDCLAAARWVAAGIARHGGDPRRVAVAGDSSGGTLAAVVSQHEAAIPGLGIVLQALIYPGTDLRANSETYRTLGEGFFLTAAKMRWFIGNYLARAEDALDPRASPLLADSLAGQPPALIITAGLDPLLDEGRAYADRLREAGTAVEVVNYEGWPHGFFFWSDTEPARDAMARLVQALRAALADDGAGR